MKIKKLKTITIFKENQLLSYVKHKKYNLISCGASRGGTSTLGILMRYFGLTMGNNLHPTTHEDIDVVECVIKRDIKKLLSVLESKKRLYPEWSLKLPWALKNLHVFDSTFERAVFFIIIRNPLSVSKSLIKHDKDFSENLSDYIKGIEHVHEFYKHLDNLKSISAPFILCEYEKILQDPFIFIQEFVQSLGLEVSENHQIEALKLISKSGYKSLPASL